MNRLLYRDAFVRVLSVVVAVVLWLSVSIDQPAGDPQQVLEGVDVSVRNVDPRLAVLEIQPGLIDVTVQGPGELLANLSREDVQAYVNLQGTRQPGWAVLQVEGVNVPRGVTLVNYAPSQIRVRLDETGERRMDVTPVLIGAPAAGFEVTGIEAEPRQVSIRGAATRVNMVERAEVELDIDGLTRERRFEVPVTVVGAEGEEVGLVPETVTVTVRIEPSEITRRLPVRVPILGTPAAGYSVAEVAAEPAEVTVLGRRDVLLDLDFALTQPLDLSGRSEDFSVNLGWNLPEGVRVEDGDTARVVVDLKVQENR